MLMHCWKMFVPRLILLALFLGSTGLIYASEKCPAGKITSQNIAGGVQWTIEQPPVNQRLSVCEDIAFHEGQVVIVQADGYVNTNIQRSRWYSYVNPCSFFRPSADRLYHGLIWIPGAVAMDGNPVPVGTGPVPISSVADVRPCRLQHVVNPFARLMFKVSQGASGPKHQFLHLGYQGDEKGADGKQADVNPNSRFGYTSRGADGCEPSGKHRCAKLVITIFDAVPSPDPTNATQKASPFDVKATAVDVNGFLLSPQWEGSFQLATIGDAVGTTQYEKSLRQMDNTLGHLDSDQECGGFPYRNPWLAAGTLARCTRQASFDTPHLVNVCLLEPTTGRFHGHVNWIPATYIGRLALHVQASDPKRPCKGKCELETFSADGDIDLHVVELTADDSNQRFAPSFDPTGENTSDSAARTHYRIEPILTQDSQGDSEYRHLLQLEYNEKELQSVGSDATAWGEMFNRKQNVAPGLVYRENHTAIINGLLDLDCVHDCHTELHPVFAVALRDKLEMELSENNFEDTWTIFARDRGNEGSCSQNVHFLDREEFSFYLPRPRGPTEAQPVILADELRSSVPGLQWSATADGGGVLLKLGLAPSDHHQGTPVGVSGKVTIKWHSVGNSAYSGSIGVVNPGTGTEGLDFASIFKELTDYFRPVIGASFERLWVPNAPLWPIGIQGSLVNTPLISFLGEAEWAPPREASSTSGARYTTHAALWLAGADIASPFGAVHSQPNLFLELSGGEINRSADPKTPGSPIFEHFRGKNAVFSYGLGYTFHPIRATWFSVRTVIGDLYIPASHDHVFRLSVSPQIRIRPQQ